MSSPAVLVARSASGRSAPSSVSAKLPMRLAPLTRSRERSVARVCFALAALVVVTPVHADRGALSLDVGVGAAGLSLAAPYASSGGNIAAVDFEAMLGLRFAVTNELEFTLAGYYEPDVSYMHNSVTITEEKYGSFSGNVTHSLSAFGLVAGIRYVRGTVWKLVVGLEGGWNHRAYSGIQFEYPGNQATLPSFGTDNIVIQPLVGVEWAFADHWSASLLPRFTILIGPDATIGASLMLSISYSWFL
jgi:hypothetical protein